MNETEIFQDKAKNYLSQHNISFSDAVLISNLGMHSKKSHVFVLSSFNIIVLTQKKVSKNISKKYDRSIFDISSISITKLHNIEIIFKKTKNSSELTLTFQVEDLQKLVYSVVNYIHRLLTPFEFNAIKIDESSNPPALVPCTSHSALSRLNYQLMENQIEVPENLIEKVSHHLYSHLNSFIFSKFRKMKKFFPIFFPCISMVGWVNQIDIYSPKHVFNLMFKQINCFDTILHVKIRGTESKEIQDFVEKSKNVNALSFHDRPVNTFDFISVLIQNRAINSIGFDSALNEVSFPLFMNLQYFENLKYFRVSNLNNLDFLSNFQKFKKLKVLSLTSCNLKIGQVLEELIKNQVIELKKLDLSGNIGSGFHRFYKKIRKEAATLQQQFQRPKTLGPSNRLNLNRPPIINNDKNDVKVSLQCKLDALFVNEVEWDIDQLIFFMNLCSNSIITNLSINNICFSNSHKGNNQPETNNNINNNINKRNRHRSSTRINTNDNNNDNDNQNDFEEEEEDSDYYDDDDNDSAFAMSTLNINANNNVSNQDIVSWDALFDNFPKQMDSIRSINWNSNKITNIFVNFLLASPKLNEVSFCGCDCSDIPFIETLLKKHHIQKVNLKQIQFNTNLLYFHTFKNFLTNIPQMKFLKQIDLSHNDIDDECFETLSTSLMNSNLEFIALDNSKASSYEVLNKFYHKLEKSKEQPITISYPYVDFKRLEVDNFGKFDMIQCFNNLKKPLSQRTTELEKHLSEVSFLRLDNNFPQFLGKNENEPNLNQATPTNENSNNQTNNIKNSHRRTNSVINTNVKNINHRRTHSISNVNYRNANFDDDDDDDFPKPKFINSRNGSPKINQRKTISNYINDDSTSDENPRSTFKKTNNSSFSSPNRIITNLNEDNDIDDSNNKRGNTYYFNNNNKSSTNSNLSPTTLNRQSSFDIYENDNNTSLLKHSRKNNDFMNFSPNSDVRHWSIRKPENWKGRVLPAPPKIDNTEIFINYKREFNIQRLVNKMVKK